MSLSANEVEAAAAGDPSAARTRPYLAVVFGIVALTLIAYAPIYRNDFIYLDDPDYVSNNGAVPKGLTSETFRWAWTTTHHGFWHPLTWLSLLADVSMFGRGAWGMHLTNVILHLATSIGLFLVFVRMTNQFWPSAMLAALFAVHPMHVESVAWAAERKDVLSTFFLMLTLAAYVESVRRPCVWRHALTIVFFALGLLAKPMLVTLPLGLLLFDVWPLRRTSLTSTSDSPFPARPWPALVAEKLPMFALAIGFSIVTLQLQKNVGAAQGLDYLSWQPRIANVLLGYVWYVTTTLMPVQLMVFHTHRWAIPPVEMILPFVVLAAITIGFVLLFRKHPELLIGWLWFGGTLFPVSGIAQSGRQAYADRFAYVPHIGLFIVLIWGGLALARRLSLGPRVLAGVAAMVLVVFTGLSFRQVTLWLDTETLFGHALAIEPDNHWLRMILGEYYWKNREPEKAWIELDRALSKERDPPSVILDVMGEIEFGRGQFREAEATFRRALQLREAEGGPRKSQRLSDREVTVHHNLALALARQEKYDEAAAVLEKLPEQADSQRMLAEIRVQQRRYDDAIACLTAALQLDPKSPESHYQLGLLYLKRNQFDLAEKQFAGAIALRPDSPMLWSGLYRALGRQKHWEQAEKIAADAVALFPKAIVFRGDRAHALYQLARRTEARNEYDEIERVCPGWADKNARTAFLMATSGADTGSEEALELAELAAESTDFNDGAILEVLASCQAGIGHFDDAVSTIDRALRLPMPTPQRTERLHTQRDTYQRREKLRPKIAQPEQSDK